MTTCQICGRAIKTRTTKAGASLIAQHGYAVPWGKHGDHQRTQSCAGSNHLPYEISRDAIPPTLGAYRQQLDRTHTAQQNHRHSPPDELVEFRNEGYRRREIRATKPAGFDPTNTYAIDSYATLYRSRSHQYERDIRGLIETIDILTQRYNNWKPTTP